MNKLSETILSILGDCWEKFICSSLPARLMEEFPASKVHLQPPTSLTGKFPSKRKSRHYWPVWLWTQGNFSPSVGGSWGGGGGVVGGWVSEIAHTSYSRHQRTKSPQTSWTVYFPATISPFKDILFFPNLPASEKLPEEQIFWGTDPLGAPVS